MSFYIQYWQAFLRTADPLFGLPLFALGATLVMAGWRLWRAVAVGSLALVGALIGHMAAVAFGLTPALAFAGAGAVLFGLASLVLVNLSSTVLGGCTIGFAACLVLGKLGIHGGVQWAAAALAFTGAAAWSYANRERVIILVTSLEGAALVVSGLAIMVTEWEMMYDFIHSMTARSPIVIPFFMLVPTVVGITLQLADAARSFSKDVKG